MQCRLCMLQLNKVLIVESSGTIQIGLWATLSYPFLCGFLDTNWLENNVNNIQSVAPNNTCGPSQFNKHFQIELIRIQKASWLWGPHQVEVLLLHSLEKKHSSCIDHGFQSFPCLWGVPSQESPVETCVPHILINLAIDSAGVISFSYIHA